MISGLTEGLSAAGPSSDRRSMAQSRSVALVRIAQETDPHLALTAKTMPENGPSARIFASLKFLQAGTVSDHAKGTPGIGRSVQNVVLTQALSDSRLSLREVPRRRLSNIVEVGIEVSLAPAWSSCVFTVE